MAVPWFEVHTDSAHIMHIAWNGGDAREDGNSVWNHHECIRRQVLPLVCVGSGRFGLSHKLQADLHQHCLELGILHVVNHFYIFLPLSRTMELPFDVFLPWHHGAPC